MCGDVWGCVHSSSESLRQLRPLRQLRRPKHDHLCSQCRYSHQTKTEQNGAINFVQFRAIRAISYKFNKQL